MMFMRIVLEDYANGLLFAEVVPVRLFAVISGGTRCETFRKIELLGKCMPCGV
ncbi:MAG: hypothetical protein FWF98_00130 [Dehalococcoidia bacterium]|nr:hypothetical protein [Dehalococcoidia bacterium]